MEADGEREAFNAEEQKDKTRRLEAEAVAFDERMKEEDMIYESTLAEVYNAHREQVDALNVDLTANDDDLQQGHAAMNQWRTQWEEELTEKNSIDAELLTLRSEFEKSSATYDREIEGLKELLEKEGALREEMEGAMKAEESELEAHQKRLETQKTELTALSEESASESRNAGDMEAELDYAKSAAETDRTRYESAMAKMQKLDAESETLRGVIWLVGEAGATLAKLREELETARSEAGKYADVEAKLEEVARTKAACIAETEALKSQTASMAETSVTEQSSLAEALTEARSAAAKWEQEFNLQTSAKGTLNEEVNSLKNEAKELTDAHSREVERLNERLSQLERVHDTLDVTLAEEEAAFEASQKEKKDQLESSTGAKEAAIQELVAQQEDVRAQLAEVRTLLTQEQRDRQAAEDAMRDVREMAEGKTADAEERERRLQNALDSLSGARASIEKEAASEKAKFEEKMQTLGGEQADTNRKQKEAEERAVEFERQWVAESKLRKDLHNQLEEMVGNLRVYCRVRPASKSEEENPLSVEVKGADRVMVKDHDDDRKDPKRYDFTHVYGPGSTQEELFKDTNSLMTSVLDGFNVCIFAYGQSGTGKTFTMNGNDELPGLVPRAMAAIFENVGEREVNYKHDASSR